MNKIGWIEIASRKYGGKVYEEQAKEILAENFDFEKINIQTKIFKRGYLRAPEIFLNLLRMKGEKDLWIRNSNTVITLPLDKTKGKNLIIIHHIDFSQSRFPFRAIDFLLEKMIYFSLKKSDAILTVSQYWQDHFLKKGYANVFKIYNSFDVPAFDISDQETLSFKKEHQLEGKPIIYLGNCQKAKGVLEAYENLKGLNAYLVTSGERMVDVPTINLQLEYKDYLRLLKSASVAVVMSKFKEGWCRTAHEAMLLKTPVVGSGSGGMKELLDGGKQIICPKFEDLRQKVEYLLANSATRNKMGEDGYNFAKNFTREKFKEDWISLIQKITK